MERTDPLLGVTAYAYDAVGNRTSLSDPVGSETHLTYDAMNRVTVETNELGHAREFAYDELGSLTRREDRNGRVVEYDYDRLQRRTEERWLDGGGAAIRTIEFSYDAGNQLTGASDPDSAYTYTCDAVGNIEAVEHESALLGKTVRLEQAIDAVGNRLQVLAKIDGVADVVTDYVYDALNRMTRLEQAGAAVAKRVDVAYDAAGQFATIGRVADLAGTQSVVASGYTFDAGGRLTGLAHGTLATYGWTYDAGNRLTRMMSPDGTGGRCHATSSGNLGGIGEMAGSRRLFFRMRSAYSTSRPVEL